jgi:probable rRNA maturation factor
MDIILVNLQKKAALSLPQIKTIVKKILKFKRIRTDYLSFSFVTAQKIKSLNKTFLKRTYVTDVLAFDLMEKKKKNYISGDIIICPETAFKNAKLFGTSFSYELSLYLVHGILHLAGFDDHSSKDIQAMRKEEQKIMTHLGPGIRKISVDYDCFDRSHCFKVI